jgi:hypothetical protein
MRGGTVEDQTQERLAAIGRVAAGVAHDFNNILTVITLSAELLGAQSELDEAGREQLRQIRRETERGASIVWQILDFAHRAPLARKPVDLDAFILELLPVLRRTQPPGVSITLRTDGAAHHVMGDAARLEQILTNLATNAADAIGGAGRIDIALDSVAPEAGMAPTRWARVTFSDSGAGIPAEVLPRIFEPFFSTKQHGHGTGLGMAQVDGLVSQHEGHVRVSSVVGEGTAVEIWLPAIAATGDGSGDGTAHHHVGADAGDVELLAHHLETGPAVEAHRAHAGVAPELRPAGLGHRLQAGGEQGGAEAGAPHVGVGGHAPEAPAAGGPAGPVLLVERGDADEPVAVEGAEVHAGVVARVAGLEEGLARAQHLVPQRADVLGGNPPDQPVRGIHAGRAAS